MTDYAKVAKDGPELLFAGTSITSGDGPDQVYFSHDTMLLWSDEEREAHGIVPVVDDEVPAGQQVTGSSLEVVDGVVHRRWTTQDIPPRPVDGVTFMGRFSDDELQGIYKAATESVQLARWIDMLRMGGEIHVTGKTAQAAKAWLVGAGLLTQERADTIFTAA